MYLAKVEYRYLDAQGTSFSSSPEECGDSGDQRVLYKFEYHIIYSLSYQVPVLYFSICDQAGQTVSIDWLWRRLPRSLLTPSQTEAEAGSSVSASKDQQSEEQLYALFGQMVTQAMHPISGSPTFTIHPCRTAQLMSPLVEISSAGCTAGCRHCQGQLSDRDKVLPWSSCTCNYLITWLSSLAPVAGLLLPNQYGLL